MVTMRSAGKANISDMAALLDPARQWCWVFPDHAQQWVAVCFQENIRFQKSRRSSEAQPMARRVVRRFAGKSLCGGDAPSTPPRGGGVAARNSE